MKKSNVAKVILVILIGIMLLTIRTGVYAADSDNGAYQDLAQAVNNTTDDDSDDSDEEEENSTNDTGNNSTGNNTLNTSSLRNTSNIANKANTANVYNNTNLPKTGISDSVPVVVLIVIFGISAAYAYKKVKDYRNL